ncbi:MAG: putative 2-phosphosulfolactate phosphatase, partial [Candidatus Rokubacteria bacterium]|nr:putative 2-phosphosulfolactate phosphatase [Candidatus Rokubacteria bacterium]
MRVHVALTPGEFPDLTLGGRAALVVDVLRATSMVVAAFDAGCARVIPVADAAEARERSRALLPEPVLLAGERGGEQIE